jgi:hypothetical protein
MRFVKLSPKINKPPYVSIKYDTEIEMNFQINLRSQNSSHFQWLCLDVHTKEVNIFSLKL